MKRYHTYVIISFSSILFGMLLYRNNWFPRPQLNAIKEFYYPKIIIPKVKIKETIISQYSKGVPLFSDRNYVDLKGCTDLENTFVIQIPRHFNKTIKIKINSRIKMYRILTDANDNKTFDNWTKTGINLSITGQSCIHKIVVSKVFNPGIIQIESGGPISATPILIKNILTENKIPFTIIY
jgi:hypothetical protein